MTDEEYSGALRAKQEELGRAIREDLLGAFESHPVVAAHLAAEPDKADEKGHMEWAETLSKMATFSVEDIAPGLFFGPTL